MIETPPPPAPPQDVSLPAECLVAFLGIFPTRGPTDLEIRGGDVGNYLARIRRRIAKFLESKDVEPIKWTRPPTQQDLWDNLTKPFDNDELSKWFRHWQSDIVTPVHYPIIIQQARDFIRKAWPVYPDTTLGLHNFELAPDEYGDVWHLTRSLNDPETIFDDMDSLVLLPVQVDAIAAVFPSLYQKIKELVMLLLQPYVGIEGSVDPRKVLYGEREEQIRTLLQLKLDAPIETAKEEPQSAPAKPQQSDAEMSDDAQTPTEHVARRRTLLR